MLELRSNIICPHFVSRLLMCHLTLKCLSGFLGHTSLSETELNRCQEELIEKAEAQSVHDGIGFYRTKP